MKLVLSSLAALLLASSGLAAEPASSHAAGTESHMTTSEAKPEANAKPEAKAPAKHKTTKHRAKHAAAHVKAKEDKAAAQPKQ